MQAQGLSNAELPQRMGTSPAYITRLFRGSANLSADTMVELARAVESTLQVALNGQPTPETGRTTDPRASHAATPGTTSPSNYYFIDSCMRIFLKG